MEKMTVNEIWERLGAFEENAVGRNDLENEEDEIVDETYFQEKPLPENLTDVIIK